MRWTVIVTVLLVGLAAGWSMVARTPDIKVVQLDYGMAVEPPVSLDEFRLVDHRGQPFTRHHLEGQWSLLFIGFTHCPDICPMTLNVLGIVQEELKSQGHQLQGVFVSVDPDRDTPDELARYLDYFGSDLVGVTGDKDQLDRLCNGLDFAYVKVPRSGGEYTVDHSGALALIGPGSQLKGYFLPPFQPNAIAADLKRVL